MKIIKGDLIKLAKQGHFDVIVHGCNCFNTFGRGIALTIKEEFPQAFIANCKTEKGDITKLGKMTSSSAFADNGLQFTIVNAYTQYTWWGDGDLFEYAAFQNILLHFTKVNAMYPKLRWGFPLIGCGLAGGNKERILKMMEDTLVGMDVTVVEFEKE